MNFLDAIKSGRPFRRPSCPDHPNWHTKVVPSTTPGGDAALVDAQGGGTHSISYEDLLAEDWEVQEREVTITRSQFFEAVERYRNMFWPNPAAACLAKYLGLED